MRSTRRTSVAQSAVGKENQNSSQQENPKKPRSRLSTTELARLEDVFKHDTHPTRQQKRDLATELAMDYKTVTIWFQNRRQTAKRGQPPGEKLERSAERPRLDSCLRAVSSPSHNATLSSSSSDPDHSTADAAESKSPGDRSNTVAVKTIVKIKPLLDSLNGLTSRPRGRAEPMETRDEAPNVAKVDPQIESDREDQTTERDQTKGTPTEWKRIRTLEWACERQTKRRKLSRNAYTRLGSQEPNDTHMDSALSLLSLASSTQVEHPKDVMRGALLLLGFMHSWRRKQQV